MAKESKRPKFCGIIANEMEKELLTQGHQGTRVGEQYENIKTLVRYRLTKEEITLLCECLAFRVVANNTTCYLTEKRDAPKIPVNRNSRIFQ